MSGGGKHLWNPSMVVRSGNRTPRPPERVGYGMLKIAKRGKATNGCSLECNDAWVLRFSTPLSQVSILKLWARAQIVVLCLPTLRCSNQRNLFVRILVVAWVPSTAVLGGLQIRGWSLLHMRAFSCCSLGTTPSSRGEGLEDFDGCSFVNCCSLENGSIVTWSRSS